MVTGVVDVVEQRLGGSNPVAKTMKATAIRDSVTFIIVALVEEDMGVSKISDVAPRVSISCVRRLQFRYKISGSISCVRTWW